MNDYKQQREMSKRVMLTLPDKIYQQLEEWATDEGRPVANLAAFLVELAIREREKLKNTESKSEK